MPTFHVCCRTLLCLALAGCGCGDPGDPRPQTCADIDTDGDGVSACDDCNDESSFVFPGATDAWYDGVDANCDGLNDYDQDGDGDVALAYGGRDCDDTDPTIDGIDHDNDQGSACAGDCDDSNPLVSPWAVRVCGDGLDNDCDGIGDCHLIGHQELPNLGLPLLDESNPGHLSDFKLPAGARSSPLALARASGDGPGLVLIPTDWQGTIDVDDAVATFVEFFGTYAEVTGDGIPDVVTIGSSQGSAVLRVYPGPHAGTYDTADAAVSFAPIASGNPTSLGAFDHDDDGRYGLFGSLSDYADLNFGAPYDRAHFFVDDFVSGTGTAVSVVHAEGEDGVLSLLDSTHDLTGSGHPDLVFMDHDTYVTYIIRGTSLTPGVHNVADIAYARITNCSGGRAVSDLNQDGFSDLVCHYSADVNVFFGPIAGGDLDGLVGIDLTVSNMYTGDIRTPGDVDGDGNADLLVGTRPYWGLFYGPFAPGAVIDSDTAVPDATFDANFGLNTPFPLGDNNGDGLADFFVGGGGYYLVHGGPSGVY